MSFGVALFFSEIMLLKYVPAFKFSMWICCEVFLDGIMKDDFGLSLTSLQGNWISAMANLFEQKIMTKTESKYLN
jgi:hypothetical protein